MVNKDEWKEIADRSVMPTIRASRRRDLSLEYVY